MYYFQYSFRFTYRLTSNFEHQNSSLHLYQLLLQVFFYFYPRLQVNIFSIDSIVDVNFFLSNMMVECAILFPFFEFKFHDFSDTLGVNVHDINLWL